METKPSQEVPQAELSIDISATVHSIGHGLSGADILYMALADYKEKCMSWLVRYHTEEIARNQPNPDFSDAILEWEHIKMIEEWQLEIVQGLVKLAEHNYRVASVLEGSIPVHHFDAKRKCRHREERDSYDKFFKIERK